MLEHNPNSSHAVSLVTKWLTNAIHIFEHIYILIKVILEMIVGQLILNIHN